MANDLTTSNGRGLRKRIGLSIALLGMAVFLLGTKPGLFGINGGQLVGFVQIEVFTLGLGLLTLGGYFTMEALWRTRSKLVITEFGARFVATGFVIALASGMADVFGLGTRPLPSVPFFGYWQGRGVLIGELVILLGFVMMAPWWERKKGRGEAAAVVGKKAKRS